MERLSEAWLKQFKMEDQKWADRQKTAVFIFDRPANPRGEALAALDALGPAAVDALPALEKLLHPTFLHETQPDPRALFVAARIGPASVPLLTKALTSENKLVRLQAQICLDMMSSRSEVLCPKIPIGPGAPSFDRRICEFNLKTSQAAVKEYEGPDMEIPNDVNQIPPPRLPPP